ncbi:MAG: helix-turn-helix domain-containing protein [Spirochaetaceae bacterium]|jgi:excisionase family DNA binding protein|nr:helix-turn-helix domain-containing protein [Spirochaetaceae bacterium]
MQLLNIEEAAENLRTSPITIRRMVKAGTIPHRRLGTGGKNTRIFFTTEDLEAYLKAAAVPAKESRHG